MKEQQKVIIYSTPTCPWCVKAKEYFHEKGIKYEEVNVAADKEKAKEMVEKSGQMGVPVIEIGDTIIIGFDKDAIDEELGL